MAKFAENLYTASGATANFVVSFPFIERSHVSVYLDDVLTAAYTWVDDSNITLDATPDAGVIVKIVRDSSVDSRMTNFNDGSRLTESDLDTDGDQAFYLVQESRDKIEDIDTVHDEILADIQTNADNIASNDVDIAANVADIATNTSDIATNAADIVTNTADIIAGDTATLIAAKIYADALSGQDLSPWNMGNVYEVDNVVEYNNIIYQCIVAHTAGVSFDASKWEIISRVLTDAEIKVGYENNADTNAFTDAEKTKLGAVETGATADQTGAEIKIAYEGEANTNAFTNSEQTKLGNIENNATADQTGAEIKVAYEGEANTNAFTDAEKTKLATVGTNADVQGPASSTDNSVPRFDSTTGKIIQGSNVIIDDLDNITGVEKLNATELDIIHTAMNIDDHALEINVAAGGYGDVKALDIIYDTGAIGSGDDEAVILVNIDESNSVGGDITALEVVATEGLSEVNGMLAGINVNPIEQLSGTFGDMDSALVNGVDKLAEFISSASDTAIFTNDNDTVVIGNATKFEEIEFLLSTTASGSGIAPTFEYSTGVGTWASFAPVDGTNGMKNTGVIVWLDRDIPSWTVGTGSEYLIRITRTKNSVATTPIEDKVQIGIASGYYWDKSANVHVNEVKLDSQITLKEIATPSTPAAGYKSIYPKSDGKVYTLDDAGNEVPVGSGSGSGGINYMTDSNTDAEIDVGDWATYTDAAAVNPVDGTGGTVTTELTFTRNTTTPMRGDADFKFSKDAANRQGFGSSCAFTIDNADKSQKLTISFDYDASDADYADDDIRISVYDVTNANLIRINGEDLKGGQGTHYAQFQAASDSTSYRLIIHQSSTNATAYDIYFDNIKVGPSEGNVGTGIESQVRVHTATGNGSTNVMIPIFSTIIDNTGGDITYATSAADGASFTINERGMYHISYSFRFNGTNYGGISLNSAQLTTSINAITAADRLAQGITGGTSTPQNVAWSGILEKGDVVRPHTEGAGYSGDSHNQFTISKIGEGTSTAVGSGRDVVVRGAGNAGAAITGATEAIDFTVVEDTTSSWSQVGVHGKDTFTAPETGQYSVSGGVYLASASTASIQAYINGTGDIFLGLNAPSTDVKSFAGVVSLNKGDLLTIRSSGTVTLSNSTTIHHIHIQKLASPQTQLETETVAARYTSDSGQTIGTAFTDMVYEDIDYDTHNAYNTSTGEYTVPLSGKYYIKGSIERTTFTFTLNTVVEAQIVIDGTGVQRMGPRSQANTSSIIPADVSTVVDLDKGQVVKIQGRSTASSGSATNGDTKNNFSIARVK